MYAAHFLPKLGYAKRAHLMNAMVPGLSGGKMSSSDPKSKIDFLDNPSEIKSKIKGALCTPGEVEGNGVLAFVKAVLIPIQALQEEHAKARGESQAPRNGTRLNFVKDGAPTGTLLTISRPDKFGGDIHFSSYSALEEAYAKEEVHPGDLKGAVTDALVKLLEPIGKMFRADPEWQEAERMGYPDASVQAVKEDVKAVRDSTLLYSFADRLQPKPTKEFRNKPPTEEERAALRLKKEQEKLAKQAKQSGNDLSAADIVTRDAKAAEATPLVNGTADKAVGDL